MDTLNSHHPSLLFVALSRSSKASCVPTELMNVSLCWSANTGVSMCRSVFNTWNLFYLSSHWDIPLPYMNTWNVHRMFITYIHRTLESRNTKNTYDFLVQVRNFLLPLSLKVLRHKERDTHSFYSGFSICPPSYTHPPQGHWPGFGELAKVNRLLPSQELNSTDFLKIPKILRARFRCMTSFTSTGQPFPGIYFDICERHILRARASTHVLKFVPN